RLVAPMDFRAFSPGPTGDGRVRLVQPSLHRLRALFVGSLQRLLRRKSPARQVFTNPLQRQRYPITLMDQLAYRLSSPQGKAQLQLVRRFVADHLAKLGFLHRRQRPEVAYLATTPLVLQAPDTLPLVTLTDVEHPGARQARLFGDGFIGPAPPTQTDHL